MALTEGNLANASGAYHCKVDGMAKVILGSAPVTGRALYLLAGNPDELHTAGGSVVKNNDDEYKGDAEFVTKNRMVGSPTLNPEHILPGDGKDVFPPHSQSTMVDAKTAQQQKVAAGLTPAGTAPAATAPAVAPAKPAVATEAEK
jgi:hypothetical protein